MGYKLVSFVVCIFSALLLAGCAATGGLWQPAVQESVAGPRIVGISLAHDRRAPIPTHLIVRYSLDWYPGEAEKEWPKYFAVALNADGSPPSIFDGTGNSSATQPAELTPDRIGTITSYSFSEHSERLAKTLMQENMYVPSTEFADAGFTTVHLGEKGADGVDGVVTLLRYSVDAKDSDKKYILVVPCYQKRTTGDRAAATAVAVVLTPATLLVDTIVYPLVTAYAVFILHME